MPVRKIYWKWEEAFDKWGFEDGDGWNGTDLVRTEIEAKFDNLDTWCDTWGCHNFMIMDIRTKDQDATIYEGEPQVGYVCPRTYLPEYLVEFLDEHFTEEAEL
tara:strand:- start:411 stop:719 length:309 start_codon:yes stop_codon:yes gene_type:complete